MSSFCHVCDAELSVDSTFCSSCGTAVIDTKKSATTAQSYQVTMTTPRSLYKSRRDKKLLGICGGLAKYSEIDSNVVRLLTVLAAFLSGGAVILAYIVAAFVLPYDPEEL